jgi:carboxyl-terminal processing protease
VGEADLDHALPFDRIAAEQFDKVNFIDAQLIDRLRAASKERTTQSTDFKKVLTRAERYRSNKEKATISLNEAKFLAEVNADKEEGDLENEIEEEMNEQDRPVVKKDYYFDETMAVVLDYLKARQPVLGAQIPAPPVP